MSQENPSAAINRESICEKMPVVIESLEWASQFATLQKYAAAMLRIAKLADSILCDRPAVFGDAEVTDDDREAADKLVAEIKASCENCGS